MKTSGKTIFGEDLEQYKHVIDKLSTFFLNLNALTGREKRPNAYARLHYPKYVRIQSWISVENTVTKVFSIDTVREKTVLALNIPCFLFPSFLKTYIRLHVTVIRSLVARICLAAPSSTNIVTKHPLLHPRSETELASRNISQSIKSVMPNMDPQLNSVTCTTLKASHPTSLLHIFLSGKFWKNISEKNFATCCEADECVTGAALYYIRFLLFRGFLETIKIMCRHLYVI